MAANPRRALLLLFISSLAAARPNATGDGEAPTNGTVTGRVDGEASKITNLTDTGPVVDGEVPKWKMYFTNDTVTGRVVPCTDAEKFCLSRGLLLYEPNGKCYLYGDKGPCEWDEYLRVDKRFLDGSGRVRAACVKRYLCGQTDEFKMAYDGSCLRYSAMLDLCYAEPGLTQSENLFGETECSCRNSEQCPVKQQPVKIPSQDQLPEGQCAVRALRDTQLPRLPWAGHVATPRAEVPCSETERRCFLDGRVYLPKRDLCYELWRRGPCADGQWLLLDREEAVNGSGRLVGVCEAMPCGPDRVLSMADGSCQTPEELCGAYGVTYNLTGAAACSRGYDPLRMPTLRKAEGLCRYPGPDTEAHPPPQHLFPPPPAPPACPDSTTGYCKRHVHHRPSRRLLPSRTGD